MDQLEKLRKEIEETAVDKIEDFISSFDKINLSKNRKKVRKCAKDLEQVLSKNKLVGKEVSSAIIKLFYCITGYNRVAIYITKQEEAVSIWVPLAYQKEGNRYKVSPVIEIYIHPYILTKFPPKQVVAILLHEIGHFFYVNKRLVKFEKWETIVHVITGIFILILAGWYHFATKDKKLLQDRKKGTIFVILSSTIALSYIFAQMYFTYKISKEGGFAEEVSDSYATVMGYGKELKDFFITASGGRREVERISPRKFLRILMRRLKGIPHDPMDIRICKILRLLLEDPDVKKDSKLFISLKSEFKAFRCEKRLS